MWCLTLATNAIVCWMSEYLGLAVAALRATGRHIDDETLAHVWPTHHENVLLYGTHTVDIDAELAGLDAIGYRPLRLPASDEPIVCLDGAGNVGMRCEWVGLR